MLARQRALQERLGYDFESMTPEQRVAYIKEMYIAAVKELGEALDETQWKPWAKGEHVIHQVPFGSELSDAWQFITNMWFVAYPGVSITGIAEMMNTYHETKVDINHRRIDQNYDGKNKCPTCKRALDDPHVDCEVDPNGGGHHCTVTGVTYLNERSS